MVIMAAHKDSDDLDENTLLFDRFLFRLEKRIPFLGMNPLNEDSEKKKFFSEDDYSPRFRYAKHSFKYANLLRKCEELKLDESVINRLLLQKLQKFKKTSAMLQGLGGEEFIFFSGKIFGVPSKQLVNKAHRILKQAPVSDDKKYTSRQVVSHLRRSLKKLGLKEWGVRIKSMTANAAVNMTSKKVFVKKNEFFSRNFLKRVVAHEIGAHVLRIMNGEKQPYILFRRGLPGYLMTEEGLAVNIEEMFDCLKINTLRAYAARVVSVDLSLKAGFREVFGHMKEYFDDSLAWRFTVRAKRGLTDTSLPGAYTKDHLYLKGYYEVKKFLEKKGGAGLKKLYYGKIGLEHIHLMPQIKGLKEPDLTPASKDFKKVLSKVMKRFD